MASGRLEIRSARNSRVWDDAAQCHNLSSEHSAAPNCSPPSRRIFTNHRFEGFHQSGDCQMLEGNGGRTRDEVGGSGLLGLTNITWQIRHRDH